MGEKDSPNFPFNRFSSEYSPVESGVPQMDHCYSLFIVQDPFISAADLNGDLKTISQWANQWKMEFNHGPSKQATEM